MTKKPRKTKSVTPQQEDVVVIYSDGGCKPNPGPGGWGAILQYGSYEREISGGEHTTTNNRMELTAAIKALSELTRPCNVIFYTDSQYLRRGITEWIQSWIRNNWHTSTGAPVVNIDLWKNLFSSTKIHKIQWCWVKSHSDDVINNRVDRLATLARESLKK